MRLRARTRNVMEPASRARRPPLGRRLLLAAEREVEFALPAFCDTFQRVYNIIVEVLRLAMGFQCRLISILLVDEEARGIGAVSMHDVHQAPRF